jgi:DNA topoisomerase I
MDESVRPAPETLATLANLVYVDLEQPGLVRKRRGRGFAFYDCDGTLVTDYEQRARLKQLAIPPAWTDVWVCGDPTGHIQVTGRDERGRKQYIYHPHWNAVRDEVKFGRLIPFAEALPALRSQVEADLRRRTLTWEKVVAISN